MALTQAERETLQLHHDGRQWTMSAGRFAASWPVCDCARKVCTCERLGAHRVTHCHAGHAEHAAIKLRRFVWGR